MGLVHLPPRQLDLFSRRPREPLPVPVPEVREAVAPEVSQAVEAAPEGHRRVHLEQARVLAVRIAERLGGELKVLLTVHDNRSTMVSFRKRPPVLQVRLHHMFLEAPDPVVDALADYAGRGKRVAGNVIDEYIAAQETQIRKSRASRTPLEARGQCFDLQVILNDLNEKYFQSGIQASIGWGRQSARRRKRSIRLGVYDHKAREIRIHPALDKPDVPRFFVEFVVFHEMLHQLFPSARDSGRNVHHPRAFRDREKAFPHYAVAITWEREHLSKLLRR